MHLALDRVAVLVRDADAVELDFADVAFLEEDELARHRQQRGHVGGGEVLVLAEAHDHGTAHARKDQPVGMLLAEHDERICAFQFRHGGTHGTKQVTQ